MKFKVTGSFNGIDTIILEFPTPLFHERFAASNINMQELPCYFISGMTSTNNNHKCVLIEGNSANKIPVKIMIRGFTIPTTASTTLNFYIAGIVNPSTLGSLVGITIKFYDAAVLER